MRFLIPTVIFIFITISVNAQIDYASEIEPIMTQNCNSCHAGGGSGFDSSPYSDLINSMSGSSTYNKKHIIPEDPDGSPLVDKIEANPDFGSRMPQGGQLTNDQISKIRQWIAEGANEEVQTSNEPPVEFPSDFKLLGNYPNPFNPSTTIQFQVPEVSQFRIAVYNANGQLVLEKNGTATVGVREESVNLSANPSGVYFYRVSAIASGLRTLIGSGKMTLIK